MKLHSSMSQRQLPWGFLGPPGASQRHIRALGYRHRLPGRLQLELGPRFLHQGPLGEGWPQKEPPDVVNALLARQDLYSSRVSSPR